MGNCSTVRWSGTHVMSSVEDLCRTGQHCCQTHAMQSMLGQNSVHPNNFLPLMPLRSCCHSHIFSSIV